nr:MAG TPA: hypothetical protein [Caudoviricetes sp.]
MFWVWFAAITLATIAGIVVCVTQVINSIEIMKHKKRTWLDVNYHKAKASVASCLDSYNNCLYSRCLCSIHCWQYWICVGKSCTNDSMVVMFK